MKKVNFEVLIGNKITDSEFKFFKWMVLNDSEVNSFKELAEFYKKGYNFNAKWIYYNKLKLTFETVGLKDFIMTKNSLINYESLLYYARLMLDCKFKGEKKMFIRLERNALDELLGMRISDDDFNTIKWLFKNDPEIKDIEDILKLFEIDGYDFHARKRLLKCITIGV